MTTVKQGLARAAPVVQTAVLRGALALPERVQRVLAGRRVVLDGQILAVETQLLLRLQKFAREPGAETLPIHEGRLGILRQSALAGGRQPIGSVRDLDAGGIPARLYVPTTTQGTDALLVFFHGGGWIYGDLDSHDAVCRFLAERAGVRVLSVDYRLAPEAPFPAAYDDCVAAYRWAQDHADELGADPTRYAVGGDSAGGCLATAVAIVAAREGLPLKFQLLVYPGTELTRSHQSHHIFAAGFYLTKEFMDLAARHYLPNVRDHTDPRASPLYDDIPAGLAPAYIATAGFDPLRDEGEAYARKLDEAGVEVELKRHSGQIHGFLNVVGVGRTSRDLVAEIAAKLKAGLA